MKFSPKFRTVNESLLGGEAPRAEKRPLSLPAKGQQANIHVQLKKSLNKELFYTVVNILCSSVFPVLSLSPASGIPYVPFWTWIARIIFFAVIPIVGLFHYLQRSYRKGETPKAKTVTAIGFIAIVITATVLLLIVSSAAVAVRDAEETQSEVEWFLILLLLLSTMIHFSMAGYHRYQAFGLLVELRKNGGAGDAEIEAGEEEDKDNGNDEDDD